MPEIEIVRAVAGDVASFHRRSEREALRSAYGFTVIWHEQTHEFAAKDGDAIVGAAGIRIAASLAHVDRIVVDAAMRRRGIGRRLLDDAADVANYYNCHKMSTMVPHNGAAQAFFEACGYRLEAVLPQHTFKLDMAMLRKFLL